MKKLLSIVFASIFAVSVLSGCSQQDAHANRLEKILAEGKITVSMSPDFAPYEFIDPSKSGQDQYVGSDVFFANYIADYLGVELVIEATNFDAALASVQQGKADIVISGLAYREDRAEAMELTDFFNKSSYQGILVMKDELDNYKTAEDFSGKRVGAQNGSLQQENVTEQLPEANIEILSSVSDGIMQLRAGRIDALAMSGRVGDQYAKNYDDIAISEFRFESDDLGNVAGIMKGETELLAKINEIIAIVNEEGLYEDWLTEAEILSEELSIQL